MRGSNINSSRRMHTFSQMFVGKGHDDLGHIQKMLDECDKFNQVIVFADANG
jgi:hypothetical protein